MFRGGGCVNFPVPWRFIFIARAGELESLCFFVQEVKRRLLLSRARRRQDHHDDATVPRPKATINHQPSTIGVASRVSDCLFVLFSFSSVRVPDPIKLAPATSPVSETNEWTIVELRFQAKRFCFNSSTVYAADTHVSESFFFFVFGFLNLNDR